MPQHDPMEPDTITGVEMARITVSRMLVDDEIVDQVTAVDSTGQPLVLAECLSMLSLAEHTLVAERTSDD